MQQLSLKKKATSYKDRVNTIPSVGGEGEREKGE
jgi:hypothetical protein